MYEDVTTMSSTTAAVPEFSPVLVLIYVALLALMIAAMWKVFTKAGKPGWASIVPIYNTIVMLEIAGRPLWWFLLMLIPLVNIIVAIMVTLDLAKSFGKGVGFGLLLIFLPFIGFPMLAWGDAKYVGPVAKV